MSLFPTHSFTGCRIIADSSFLQHMKNVPLPSDLWFQRRNALSFWIGVNLSFLSGCSQDFYLCFQFSEVWLVKISLGFLCLKFAQLLESFRFMSFTKFGKLQSLFLSIQVSLWDHINGGSFVSAPQVHEALLICFLAVFPLQCSDWINSVDLASSSLILSSVISTLTI